MWYVCILVVGYDPFRTDSNHITRNFRIAEGERKREREIGEFYIGRRACGKGAIRTRSSQPGAVRAEFRICRARERPLRTFRIASVQEASDAEANQEHNAKRKQCPVHRETIPENWGRALSGVITVLEDRGYMVTVREKMNNIKKVAKFYNYDFLMPCQPK